MSIFHNQSVVRKIGTQSTKTKEVVDVDNSNEIDKIDNEDELNRHNDTKSTTGKKNDITCTPQKRKIPNKNYKYTPISDSNKGLLIAMGQLLEQCNIINDELSNELDEEMLEDSEDDGIRTELKNVQSHKPEKKYNKKYMVHMKNNETSNISNNGKVYSDDNRSTTSTGTVKEVDVNREEPYYETDEKEKEKIELIERNNMNIKKYNEITSQHVTTFDKVTKNDSTRLNINEVKDNKEGIGELQDITKPTQDGLTLKRNIKHLNQNKVINKNDIYNEQERVSQDTNQVYDQTIRDNTVTKDETQQIDGKYVAATRINAKTTTKGNINSINMEKTSTFNRKILTSCKTIRNTTKSSTLTQDGDDFMELETEDDDMDLDNMEEVVLENVLDRLDGNTNDKETQGKVQEKKIKSTKTTSQIIYTSTKIREEGEEPRPLVDPTPDLEFSLVEAPVEAPNIKRNNNNNKELINYESKNSQSKSEINSKIERYKETQKELKFVKERNEILANTTKAVTEEFTKQLKRFKKVIKHKKDNILKLNNQLQDSHEKIKELNQTAKETEQELNRVQATKDELVQNEKKLLKELNYLKNTKNKILKDFNKSRKKVTKLQNTKRNKELLIDTITEKLDTIKKENKKIKKQQQQSRTLLNKRLLENDKITQENEKIKNENKRIENELNKKEKELKQHLDDIEQIKKIKNNPKLLESYQLTQMEIELNHKEVENQRKEQMIEDINKDLKTIVNRNKKQLDKNEMEIKFITKELDYSKEKIKAYETIFHGLMMNNYPQYLRKAMKSKDRNQIKVVQERLLNALSHKDNHNYNYNPELIDLNENKNCGNNNNNKNNNDSEDEIKRNDDNYNQKHCDDIIQINTNNKPSITLDCNINSDETCHEVCKGSYIKLVDILKLMLFFLLNRQRFGRHVRRV